MYHHFIGLNHPTASNLLFSLFGGFFLFTFRIERRPGGSAQS